MCKELIFTSDGFQNLTKLEFLKLSYCKQLKELPHHVTNQAFLRELYLDGLDSLRELPIKIGQLRKLQMIKIGSNLLKSLPDTLGDLSSLAHLLIHECSNLESLPTSLGDLSSLTRLSIKVCRKLKCLPSSIGHLNLLTHLEICQVDFGSASLSFAFNNLKRMELKGIKAPRISISEDHNPFLESIELSYNYHLMKIEALPAKLERLHIWGCPKLEELPSFARLSSLREFHVGDWNRIGKIKGLNYCTKLERLKLHTSWEVSGIESLEQMEKLNEGSAIGSCIQMIKKHSSNSNGNAVMHCYIINCVSLIPMESKMTVHLRYNDGIIEIMEIEKGRWAYIVVSTELSGWFAAEGCFTLNTYDPLEGVNVKLERGFVVRGEHQKLMEALLSLL
ncbi:disease resistance protein TAO1-like [Cryptomeria japonica]|uniref:disease resistance protein TAO1-like n=1 Tax=Cryptomeria japonica TaxID=3369 RepID=UPI0027DA312D|nr:disease resistance protein TAO1-like [Cryptomeria japonica]